jgi:hypothetical protein
MSDELNLKNGDVIGYIAGFPVVINDTIPRLAGPIILGRFEDLPFEEQLAIAQAIDEQVNS